MQRKRLDQVRKTHVGLHVLIFIIFLILYAFHASHAARGPKIPVRGRDAQLSRHVLTPTAFLAIIGQPARMRTETPMESPAPHCQAVHKQLHDRGVVPGKTPQFRRNTMQ